MKAARLHGIRDMRIDEVPDPEPGAGEALVKVRAMGVCGSDVHFYLDGRIGEAVVTPPFILGHEFAGEIVALGPDTDGPAVGARVAIDPAIPCMRCEVCLDGNINCCPNTRFPASPPVQGGMCEYYAQPAHLCVPLPDSLDFSDGAMLEPLGIGIHVMTLARIKPGDSVAILGAGPIGQVLLQLALASFTRAVYVSEPVAKRREMAKRAGAAAVCNPDEGDPAEWLLEQTHGRGVDVAIEAAWGKEAVGQAVQMARPGGKVVVVGIPRKDITTYPNGPARSKGLTILMSRRMKSVHERGIALIKRGIVDLQSLITHRFRLDQSPQAFELAASLEDGICKAMIEF
ncbi:MAG: alcohol dehydrogenase catalytic domain-containing protein [Anaerolineales bacterium]|nr:alcohol dehydrogenase catalytic domain-containing protein [Anaerolineales bacterium]